MFFNVKKKTKAIHRHELVGMFMRKSKPTGTIPSHSVPDID